MSQSHGKKKPSPYDSIPETIRKQLLAAKALLALAQKRKINATQLENQQ